MRSTLERRAAAVVAEFRRIGLSGYRFARLAGMKYTALMAWVKRDSGSTPAVRKPTLQQRPLLVESVAVGGPAGTVPPLLV